MVPQVFRLDISIHALLAEGDAPAYQIIQRHIEISIHALLAEGDEAEFQAAQYALISIHALLAEGDALME